MPGVASVGPSLRRRPRPSRACISRSARGLWHRGRCVGILSRFAALFLPPRRHTHTIEQLLTAAGFFGRGGSPGAGRGLTGWASRRPSGFGVGAAARRKRARACFPGAHAVAASLGRGGAGEPWRPGEQSAAPPGTSCVRGKMAAPRPLCTASKWRTRRPGRGAASESPAQRARARPCLAPLPWDTPQPPPPAADRVPSWPLDASRFQSDTWGGGGESGRWSLWVET